MREIKEGTTLVQASELRTDLDAVLKRTRASRVVLEKHHKPVAVLLDPGEYEQIEEILERYSDLLLVLEAKKRESAVSESAYIPLKAVEKRFGL